MKKHQIQGLVVLGVLAVVYSAIVFLVPFQRDNGVFWISFLFSLASLAAQVYVFRVSFGGKRDVKSRFYGFPIVRVGVLYLAAQLVLSIVFMAISENTKLWIPALVYIILAGTAVVGLVATDFTRDEVERQDAAIKANVSVMRSVQSKVAALPGQAQNEEVKRAVTVLSEAVRYSDPVSSPALSKIESELISCVDELQQAVASDDTASAVSLAKKAGDILSERNRQCKQNK